MEYFVSIGDSISKKAWYDSMIADAEDAMLKDYFEDYGVGGKYPEKSDYIDFTTVDKSPQLYHFLTMNDITCHPSQLLRFEEDMKKHIKKRYEYNCPSVTHEWFAYRGSGQKQFVEDMVTSLNEIPGKLKEAAEDGAYSTAFAFAATIATFSMLM